MPFPTPIVGGFGAIGYIAALGSDATILKIGQLVYVDCVIRARDDPDTFFLSSIFEGINDGSKKLMRDVWPDGTFAEYTKFPLENCFPLIESKLSGSNHIGDGLGLEYTLSDLAYISFLLVPFAGLRDIGFEPGETIIICPATGFYGSLAVFIAIAMGGNVIAMGRNEEKLSKLVDDIQCRFGTLGKGNANIQTVQMTGDEGEDVAKLKSFGIVDAVLDITPSEASSSNHTRCAIKALRRGGRVSLMGSVKNIGVSEILFNDITLKGMFNSQKCCLVLLCILQVLLEC